MKVLCRNSVAVVAIALVHASAQASPLDAATCDGAAFEQSQLADVPPMLERGAEWGKTNASKVTLQHVARWIELQEVLAFRCGRGKATAEALRAAAAAELNENPPPPPPPGTTDKGGASTPVAPAAVIEAPPAVISAPAVVAPADAKAKPKAKPKTAGVGEPKAGVKNAPATEATGIEVMPEAAKERPVKKQRPKPVPAKTPDDPNG